MKNFNLLLVSFLLAFSTTLSGQISQGGVPLSKTNTLSLQDVPMTQLPAFNLEEVRAEDEAEEKAGNYPRIGRVRTVDISPAEFGEWIETEDGGRLWRGAVKSRDALALSVQFEEFNLPSGASLFLYSPDFKHIIGAFTEFNNNESGIFATELVLSDEVIVEYYEPAGIENNQPFVISGVVHTYRMVHGAEQSGQRDFGDSDPCQVNANCSEGNNWQDEKRGVARIFIIEGQFAGWCTGSLVNNTAEDCTPYFLTALHCGQNASTANMNQWVFYFNYESSGCANGTQGQVPNNTMQGCARIADSGDGGGSSGSDFMLVEINNDIPGSYNPYYNGWRRNNTTSSSGVSIHHPSGDIKKISTYASNLQSTTWGGPSGTHWLVNWSSTANGHGVTEGGSSGSPIFDTNGLIIGTLTGGSSFCTSPNSPDLYGKMSYHWSSNPGDNLSTYLDPIGTGATSLSGTNQPCGSEPDCAAIIPYPESDPCVQIVITNDPSCCDVTWDAACESAYEACNSGGDDCEAGTVSIPLSQDICPGEMGIFDATGVNIPTGGIYAVQFVPDGGTGGNGTGFSITDVAPLPFEFDADINGVMSGNGFPELSGTWLATGFIFTDPEDLAGSVCSFTAVDITLNFLSSGDPACSGGGGENNDDCSDAIVVTPGTYDFSTVDATTDGPDQPGSDCDAFEQSNVNNDVWYEYTATCDGTASFSTCSTADFDTRIAVYPGGQCPPTAASLIGCNDDGDGCTGFTSYLEWAVTQGETYLLRIGGYSAADAGTGSFELAEDCGSDPGCVADIPYPSDDPCVISVIAADDYCCDTEWDNICEDAYVDCSSGGGSDNNDDCADAIIVTPGTYDFSTVDATTDGPDQPGSDCDAFEQSNVNNDVWYEYTATCDGTASFSTCNTADFDTRIAVYPGGQCPPTAASLIGCNDDGDGCTGFTSYLEWAVTQGETYLLRIGGYSAADAGTGSFELAEDCGSEPGCVADIPYPSDDPCVISVIAADDYCCDTEWDNICEDAYVDCSSGGGDCEAGEVSVSLSQDICPGELGIFDATGVNIPAGGIYGVQFVPDGGTGGNGTGFSITDVAPLPFEFDADINGVMSGNGFPELSGTWLATGFIFTDPEDLAGSVCSFTAVDITLNFLSSGDPACSGGGGENNDDCSDAIVVTPGTYDFSTVDATTDGPDQPGSDCDAFEQSNVNNDVWYVYTATCDGTASFSTCNTADFDTRIAVYPGGQCPPTAASLIGCNDDGDGCTGFTSYLEWAVTQGETYLLRIGGYSAADAGTGSFELAEDCGSGGSDECTDWVSPSTTTGWSNFNTEYGGAPANDGSGCPTYTFTTFEVWMSEAYAMDNVVEGTSYTFSHCEGPGAGSWIPEYTIIAPSGAIDASGAGDGDGCSITWVASESGAYLIVINELDNCGVDGEIDNGYPSITCNDGVTSVIDNENSSTSFEVFPNPNNGQFNILFTETGGIAYVDVLEVSGKTVKSLQHSISGGTVLALDLGANANGMYFVRITMNNQIEVKRIVVH